MTFVRHCPFIKSALPFTCLAVHLSLLFVCLCFFFLPSLFHDGPSGCTCSTILSVLGRLSPLQCTRSESCTKPKREDLVCTHRIVQTYLSKCAVYTCRDWDVLRLCLKFNGPWFLSWFGGPPTSSFHADDLKNKIVQMPENVGSVKILWGVRWGTRAPG